MQIAVGVQSIDVTSSPMLASEDIMKVRLCKRRTDNNAIANYRAPAYWISAVQNELRQAGHAFPTAEAVLALVLCNCKWQLCPAEYDRGQVVNPHLFCITMQFMLLTTHPVREWPPPKWTRHQISFKSRIPPCWMTGNGCIIPTCDIFTPSEGRNGSFLPLLIFFSIWYLLVAKCYLTNVMWHTFLTTMNNKIISSARTYLHYVNDFCHQRRLQVILKAMGAILR